jgi:hypothetical protein
VTDPETDDFLLLLFIGKGNLTFRMVIKLAEAVSFRALFGVDGDISETCSVETY